MTTTVAERMQAAKTRMDASIERIRRAFAEIDDSYQRLAVDCPRLVAETARLADSVDRLHGNLLRYDDELGSVQAGITALGDKSRRLEAIMDDYLGGRTPLRHAPRAARAAA